VRIDEIVREQFRIACNGIAAYGLHVAGASLLLLIHRLRGGLQGREQKSQSLEVQTVTKETMKMTQAFDIKELDQETRNVIGLPVAEDILQKATKEIFDWTAESCALKGGFFAVAVPLLPLVSNEIVKLEDKIDGQADA
jgi:hypothetical protein